jgi:hypothetical protein
MKYAGGFIFAGATPIKAGRAKAGGFYYTISKPFTIGPPGKSR